MKKYVKKLLVFIYHIMAKVFPMSKDKVMFMSNMGRNYSGNTRAIYEAMLNDKRFDKKKKIWAFNGEYFDMVKKYGDSLLPKGCKVVRYGGMKYYFHMATSGIWIFDTRQEPYLIKRKGALYFMTWHGTQLKKLGLDMIQFNMAGEDRGRDEYAQSFIKESAKWDYLIVQNDYSEAISAGAFGFKNTVLKIGYPRTDKLIKEGFGKDRGITGTSEKRKKILVYAPTWRDDEYLGNGFYKVPSRPDFIKLEKELGDEYTIVLKLHYLVRINKGDIPQSVIDSGFVKICGNEIDINDLYLESDGVITDYSSLIFDYSVLERPIFFFCYDLENYRDILRGFYTDFEKLAPGPISLNEDELIRDIKDNFSGKSTECLDKIRAFKKEHNKYDDGHVSEKALDVIAKHLNIQ